MRKLFFLLLLAAVVTPASQAVTVENTAGQLAQLVSDTQITELTVTGTMDARDFLFITEQLPELTTMDLSQATIVPYTSTRTLYGTITSYYGGEIPRTAFFGKKLTTVSLPEGLESIGYAAFAGCYQLQSVTLPASLTEIEDYAFAGSALTSIEVPESVMYMGYGVFSRCEALQSAVINSDFVGEFAFLGDTSLSDVQIGAHVTAINEGAFNGCTALKTITFDRNTRLSRIGDEAFINSGLENIDIQSMPMGTIGAWAFAQTHLSEISLPGTLSHLNEGALANNPLLTSVKLPDVRNSGGMRLRGAPAINLRRTIERIEDYTFAGDEQLNAGNMLLFGTKSIGNYALYNVSQEIDTMRLPSSIDYLGNYAMAGMTGMKVLKTDAAEVPELGENVWAGVNQQAVPLIAPSEESTELYQVAEQWMNFFYGPSEPQYIVGDVNGDGVVNITDVTMLISYTMTGTGTIIEQAADINGDGQINITDVTLLISMVMNGSAELSLNAHHARIIAWSNSTSDALEVQSITLHAGETRTIDVALRNTEHNYMAMQCDLVLPQGLTLNAVNGIERGYDHSFASAKNEVEDNAYTLMGTSMNLTRFAGSEGKVMRLTVTASDDFDATGAEIELTNVQLVASNHDIYLAGDALARVNQSSGLEQVNDGKTIAAVRYINVAGQQSETPFDGMNIVVTTYTDGTTTTTKVMK